VTGDVRAPRVVIHDGARMLGRVEMDVNGVPPTPRGDFSRSSTLRSQIKPAATPPPPAPPVVVEEKLPEPIVHVESNEEASNKPDEDTDDTVEVVEESEDKSETRGGGFDFLRRKF